MNDLQIKVLELANVLIVELEEKETTAVFGGEFSLNLNLARAKNTSTTAITTVNVGANQGGVNQVAGRDINGTLYA